jgi:hypothetical protein
VTDLEFANKARTYPLEELSRQILGTMRRAQSGIADQVADVMNESLGDEDRETRAMLLGTLRGRFPTVEEEQPPAGPPAPPAQTPPSQQPPKPRGKRHEAPDDEDNAPW